MSTSVNENSAVSPIDARFVATARSRKATIAWVTRSGKWHATAPKERRAPRRRPWTDATGREMCPLTFTFDGCRSTVAGVATENGTQASTTDRFQRTGPTPGSGRYGDALNSISKRQERVYLETERHRLMGTLTLARDGYRSRISDLLNATERDFIPLTDVTVELLDNDGPGTHHAFMAIARRHIVFAIPESGLDEPAH